MIKQTTFIAIILFAVFLLASENSFAQGPCLLNVGVNCPTVNNNNNNVDPGKRTVHITDYRAGEIYKARQNNQRYLLTLQSYQENGLLCEERAWVGGNFSGNAGDVVVQVGATKKVCYNPAQPVWSAQQVNSVEQSINTWTNSIYQWEKYAENCVNYINQYRTNAQAVTYGQSELNKARQWANYYRNQITSYRNAVNQVAP